MKNSRRNGISFMFKKTFSGSFRGSYMFYVIAKIVMDTDNLKDYGSDKAGLSTKR